MTKVNNSNLYYPSHWLSTLTLKISELLLRLPFFLFVYQSSIIHKSQDSRWRERQILTPFFHFHPIHRHLNISGTFTAKSAPLHEVSDRTRIGNPRIPGTSHQPLKVVSATFLLVCFVCLKESTLKTRKNVFLFHFESSFHSWDNQILTFQIFKCHDVIKCLSMKHETHFTE